MRGGRGSGDGVSMKGALLLRGAEGVRSTGGSGVVVAAFALNRMERKVEIQWMDNTWVI